MRKPGILWNKKNMIKFAKCLDLIKGILKLRIPKMRVRLFDLNFVVKIALRIEEISISLGNFSS